MYGRFPFYDWWGEWSHVGRGRGWWLDSVRVEENGRVIWDGGMVLDKWIGTTRLIDNRWAAKEAAFKAGGINRRLMWKEVEVRYLASGTTPDLSPSPHLSPRLSSLYRIINAR